MYGAMTMKILGPNEVVFHVRPYGSKKMVTVVHEVSAENAMAWANRQMLIQEAFPTLSADEREFLLSGIAGDEWDTFFGKDQLR